MEEDSSPFLTRQKGSRVAFGSCEERRLFPTYHPPTRFGLEQRLGGHPDRGPGLYDPHPASLFLRPLDARPRSKRGWYFGATTGPRTAKIKKGIKPGPPDHQKVIDDLQPPTDSYKPFNSASERSTGSDQRRPQPGPGTYDHDIPRNCHVECNESFGGRRDLKSLVTVKCTNGITDVCRRCKNTPKGDYYENSNYALCPQCYQEVQREAKSGRCLIGFHKVRDCRTIHRHDFPGREPKVLLMSEKEQKNLRYKEAYFKLYYS